MVNVSVVIPVLNRAQVLATTLAHLSAQQCPADTFEIVAADDPSHEPATKVADGYGSRLRIQYVRQDNRGRAAACNLGARHAHTGYVELLWHAYYEAAWNALFGRTGPSPAPQEGA